MEFPDLGENCTIASCKQLDWLPVKCDACQKVFCKIHYSYVQHNCPEAYRRDNQVPVCPLCNKPVPLRPGELPDTVVGAHIDNDCQSERAQSRRKVYSNRCALKGCKQKELVPVTCQKCRRNFCLKHRHEMDHQCAGFEGTGRAVSGAGAAAIARAGKSKEHSGVPQATFLSTYGSDLNRERQMRQNNARDVAPNVSGLHIPGMSEEEALRQALALSLRDDQSNPAKNSSLTEEQRTQEKEDEEFARALQESEREAHARGVTQQQSTTQKRSCIMS